MASLPPLLLIIFSMWLLISCSEAREFLVGGSEISWKVPLPSQDSLNQWAKRQRFRIGDALIFKYDNRTESVHVVNENDYHKCNTEGGDHTIFKDGNTKFWFSNSGRHHFISGAQGHCQMGLKLVVKVLSESHGEGGMSPPPPPSSSSSPAPPFSPFSPSPSPSLSPSPSPSPINEGVARRSGGGFIQVMKWLGVSLVMMFLI